MGLFKKLQRFWKKEVDVPEIEIQEDWTEATYDRSDYKIEDKDQREEYVRGCLEQIAEATKELENLQFEYSMVTSYLRDMEEIEALPEEEKAELVDCAKRINALEHQQAGYKERKCRMEEEKFRQFQRLEEQVQEGYEKLTKAEEYQDVIKRDLRKLDGEKHAYLFRRNELRHIIDDTRSMAIICTVAVILCILILFVMQYGFQMDTKLGYLTAAAVGAVAITAIFIKHNDAVKERAKVEKGIARIISIQNTVKIRFVNNTHLLDYLYMKYNVSSAADLEKGWKQYQEEKKERQSFQIAERELDECQRELLHTLRRFQVKDPMVWLHQTDALLDKKEMVEVRHGLIVRRQSLRKRMDYNKETIAGHAQNEIKDLVDKYPQYAREVLGIVGEYEKDFS